MTKRFEVGFFVVLFSVLPASENNSDPFVSESTSGGVVIFAAFAQEIVVSASPSGIANRLIREFVEGLLDEFGAG